MSKSSLLSIATTLLCATALSACWLSEDDKAKLVNSNFEFKPITGYTEATPEDVVSVASAEGPIDTRYTVEFTADSEIKIVDTDNGNQTYVFGADDVHHAFDFHDVLKAYGSFASIDTVGTDFESLTIFTPTNTNTNEYAIARLVDTANDQISWMLLGTPTTDDLGNGSATYSGGYYLSFPNNNIYNGDFIDSAQGELVITADFGLGNLGFTLTKPTNDTTDAVFGANTATFAATVNSDNEIIANGASVGGGGHYDAVDVYGGFFYGGDNAAGIMRFRDTAPSNPGDDAFGGFNAIKD